MRKKIFYALLQHAMTKLSHYALLFVCFYIHAPLYTADKGTATRSGISSFFNADETPKATKTISKQDDFHSDKPTADSKTQEDLSEVIILKSAEQSEEIPKNRTLAALNETTHPWDFNGNEHTAMTLNFSSTDLSNVLKYFEETFGVIFITDDAITPSTQGGKSLMGSKVNFSTNRPVTRKEAWNILITLLETAGVTLQPGSMTRMYRIATLAKDSPYSYKKGPLPVYIGIAPENLPEADMRIRYVYQVKNTSLEAVKAVVQTMMSIASPDPIEIPEIYAVLITDRVYNIKTMLAVIHELDQCTAPETLSFIKLTKTDATKIAELYKTLAKEEPNGPTSPSRLLGPKRSDTISYFDANVRVIAEPRTNTLFALGPIEGVQRLEKFIKDYEDLDGRVPYIPTHVYQLKYTQAEAISHILEEATSFKNDTEAGKLGGVRNGDKYLSNVTIVAEPTTNSLLITAPDEEYRQVYDLLQKVDIEQPQVSLDVMMVSVGMGKNKSLGSQIRNTQGVLGPNVNFQTGVFDPATGVVANYAQGSNGNTLGGGTRLMANLLQLITGGTQPAGSTILTLGNDPNGIWGIIRMLETQTDVKVINNPFIIAMNKYESVINVGETRRIPATTINNDNFTSQSWTSDDANISIRITPQISDNGQVTLEINIGNSEFTEPAGDLITSGNKNTRSMYTSVLVNDGGIIVIGGLSYESTSESQQAVPFFSKIPLIGWLFKSRQSQTTKSLLLVFIKTQIIPSTQDNSEAYEQAVSDGSLRYVQSQISQNSHCPVNRWFFENSPEEKKSEQRLEEFIQEGTKGRIHA